MAQPKKRGVLIAIKDSIQYTQQSLIVDPGGRYIILSCLLDSIPYTLVNIYAPNKLQLSFLNHVLRKVQKVRQGKLVIGGDFNSVIDSALDSSSSTRSSRGQLCNFLNKYDLYDPWRCHHSNERNYSFFSNPHKSYSRIDFLLVDKFTLMKVTSSSIEEIVWSDHAPVGLVVSNGPHAPQASQWRLKTEVLYDKSCLERIGEAHDEFFLLNEDCGVDVALTWCSYKAVLRGVLIQQTAYLRKKQRGEIDSLLTRIKENKAKNKSSPSLSVTASLATDRLALRDLLLRDYEQMMYRTRATFYHHGNRPGKILARQLKAQYVRRKILT